MTVCETAGLTIDTDSQGRTWEHFWVGGRYQFSNQIPNSQSFTRTHPGWIIADSGLCRWQSSPPVRLAEMGTSAPPTSMSAPSPTAVAAGAGDGAMGLLLLVGMAGAGVWAWLTRDKDIDPDYHPMSDAPQMPVLMSFAGPPMPTQGDTDTAPLYEVINNRHRPSQASDAGGFTAPWDEPSSAVIGTSSAVTDDAVTADDAAIGRSPYGFDKLKGISLKQFKEQLARQGVTPESGTFKSVELLQHPGTALFVERRMMSFWVEFGSTRLPHAVYFVFGLQDGGSRSPEFKEQYETAKAWISNWFKETLPNEQ